MKYRKLTSAASCAFAALHHMRDWELGTNDVISMGVSSDGNKYGFPEGLIFSFPVTTSNGNINVVEGIKMDDSFTQEKIRLTVKDLLSE